MIHDTTLRYNTFLMEIDMYHNPYLIRSVSYDT